MDQHSGIINITAIEPAHAVDGITVKFVHYPGCQQLIIWLPQADWFDHGTIRLTDAQNEQVLDERPVRDRLSGNIQVLWDTLELAPAAYRVIIDHPEKGSFTIHMTKYPEGVIPPQPAVAKPETPAQPVTYRDGLGNILPDEDLILREKIYRNMFNTFQRKLVYEGNFRAGTITYIEGDIQIAFYHEMGGGACKFYIDIPTNAQWVQQTKTPLSRRDDIIAFVAQTVQREQAPSWRYEISDNAITFY